jgi:hypothetical protein
MLRCFEAHEGAEKNSQTEWRRTQSRANHSPPNSLLTGINTRNFRANHTYTERKLRTQNLLGLRVRFMGKTEQGKSARYQGIQTPDVRVPTDFRFSCPVTALSLTTPAVSRDFIPGFSAQEHTSSMTREPRVCGRIIFPSRHPNRSAHVRFIDSVLPTKHLFGHDRP